MSGKANLIQTPTEYDDVTSTKYDAASALQNATASGAMYFGCMAGVAGVLCNGLSISHLNAPSFNSDACQLDPIPADECIVFPGHKESEWLLAVNLWIVGGALGAMFGIIPAEKAGRKMGLAVNGILYLAGSVIGGFSKDVSVYMLIAGRFIIGLGCGTSTAVIPVYISEVSTEKTRGPLGVLTQLGTCGGIMISNGLVFAFEDADKWPGMFFSISILGGIQAILAFIITESPRYLLGKKKDQEAKDALRKLRTDTDITPEFQALYDATNMKSDDNSSGEKKSLMKQPYLIVFITCCMLSIAQQLSGINAVFYYSSIFFGDTGIEDVRVGTLIAGGVNLLASAASVPLLSRIGRRTLVLVSVGGMGVMCVITTVCLVLDAGMVSLVAVMLYICFFEIGIGPIPFMMISELMPQDVRGTTQSAAMVCNFLSNLVVGIVFPYINKSLDNYSFIPFGVVCIVTFLFFLKFLIETKGKTPQQIYGELGFL